MKFLKFFLPVVAVASAIAGIYLYNADGTSQGGKNNTSTDYHLLTQGEDYSTLWKTCDSLHNVGLYKSAWETADIIFDKADTEDNHEMIIKAVMHQLKYSSFIEEDAYAKAIGTLNRIADDAKFPTKQVVHSITAEVYWRYFTNNRWKFSSRTHAPNFEQDDIRTWDLTKIADMVIKNYRWSLQQPEDLQRVSMNDYKHIVYRGSNRNIRPTLYDFLAHRAYAFLRTSEVDLVKPAYAYEIKDEVFFADLNSFLAAKIESQDTMSSKFYASNILQDILAFRKKENDTVALVVNDIERLKYARDYSIIANKDELYFARLKAMREQYKNHKVSAELDYYIAAYIRERGNLYRPLQGDDHKWQLKEARDLCDQARNKFPDSYGARMCAALIREIDAKSISFSIEQTNGPNKPFRAMIKHRNVKQLYGRIIEIKWDFFLNSNNDLYGDKLIKHYKTYKPVKEWKFTVPNDGDFQSHSVEVDIPGVPKGQYVILISDNEKFEFNGSAVAHANTWVSNLSFASRQMDDQTYEFRVMDNMSGEPLKGAKAQLYIRKYDYGLRKYRIKKAEGYVSDSDGKFAVKTSSDYRNFMVDITYKDDRINNSRNFYQSRPYNNNRPVTRTHFFIDRGIYRPGQTVHYKGIMIQHNADEVKVLPNRSTTVYFYDVNSQVVAQQTVKTNKYGTFSGTFTAPIGVLTGQMRLSDHNGNKYFRVEEYKRPKFEVLFDPVEGSFKLDQDITIKGRAKAYAGSNIDGAEVKYRVTRTARFPWWCYYYWGYYPSSSAMEITNGGAVTDDNGEFDITFKAIPDYTVAAKFSPTYSYNVTADVVDINGETHSASQLVTVGYNAMNINLSMASTIDAGAKPEYKLTTTNLNGQAVTAKVDVVVHRLKSPDRLFRSRYWPEVDQHPVSREDYYKKFPLDMYDDELEVGKWDKAEKVFSGKIDTEKEQLLKLSDQKKWKPGKYLLEATAKDEFGKDVKVVKEFTLYDQKSKVCPEQTYLWTAPLKTTGEPGETAAVLVGTKANNAKVRYEIEHDGKITHSEWVVLSNEQRKFEVPIEEQHRGNFAIHFSFVKDGRSHTYSQVITVPHTNKQLDIEFETFRNKLLPGQDEEWKVKIKGKKGEKVMAEMLATMYDASLDAFVSNDFSLNLYSTYYGRLGWSISDGFGRRQAQVHSRNWNPSSSYPSRSFDHMNWFGYNFYGYYYAQFKRARRENYEMAGSTMSDDMDMEADIVEEAEEKVSSGEAQALPATISNLEGKDKESTGSAVADSTSFAGTDNNGLKNDGGGLGAVKARTNFNETAFFYPHLETNAEGDIIIKFTIPESLTRWKFLGLATTEDLKVGTITEEVVTQKELMVMPNAPRFFREGDEIVFSSKITNLSEGDQKGEAQLMLFDALTMKPIDDLLSNTNAKQAFEAKKGLSTALKWRIKIPMGVQAVTYRVVAKAGKFTDGEEMAVPVLTNRMLVTESLPLPIKNKGTRTYTLEKLLASGGSSTMVNHKLTLEYTSNPAWYAIQAMPYMMEYPYECSEQTFTRFYANSLATHIVNSSPKIKRIFDSWKTLSPDAFLSNLEKNQELKEVLLQETPWVLQSQNESERKKRVALLFDLNRMSNELDRALVKLQKEQVSNGGWPWFPGMPESRYITQHIICGMGHLDHLGVKNVREDNNTWAMTRKGLSYLDTRIVEDFEEIKRRHPDTYLKEQHISHTQIHYLYMRSFYTDIPLKRDTKEAVDYFKKQAATYWTTYVHNNYTQGLIALALNRMDDKETAKKIVKSLRERALVHDELGMYWKGMMDGGYYWYEAPIETQALMIEAFDEIGDNPNDVNELRVWLIKQKQTQDWGTTKATAEACYALLLKGGDWLAEENAVTIQMGDIQVIPGTKNEDVGKVRHVKSEPGTGYFKTSWNGSEIKPEMGKVTVIKTSEGPAWGALYWQYFEQLDKITPHETPLQLKKKLFLEKMTASGPIIEEITDKTKLKPGDKVKVRIELVCDRAMEYVHMKDMRASGFEPINVLSRYKYQDGLGYYEMTKDASTNFFFGYLPRGTFVFEYELRVAHSGDFSNGITTIQCMYAPEFTSHSEGIRVQVGE